MGQDRASALLGVEGVRVVEVEVEHDGRLTVWMSTDDPDCAVCPSCQVPAFEKWVKDAHFGKMANARKGGAIIVYDYEGIPIKRYKLTNAWPKSLEIGSLKAGDTSVLTEKLVITYEQMEVE